MNELLHDLHATRKRRAEATAASTIVIAARSDVARAAKNEHDRQCLEDTALEAVARTAEDEHDRQCLEDTALEAVARTAEDEHDRQYLEASARAAEDEHNRASIVGALRRDVTPTAERKNEGVIAPSAQWTMTRRPPASPRNNSFVSDGARAAKRPRPDPPARVTQHLYTLRLRDGCWYVGTTTTPPKRLKQHRDGDAAEWTKEHPVVGGFASLARLDGADGAEARLDEDREVKRLMMKHGIEKVGTSRDNDAACHTTRLPPLTTRVTDRRPARDREGTRRLVLARRARPHRDQGAEQGALARDRRLPALRAREPLGEGLRRQPRRERQPDRGFRGGGGGTGGGARATAAPTAAVGEGGGGGGWGLRRRRVASSRRGSDRTAVAVLAGVAAAEATSPTTASRGRM